MTPRKVDRVFPFGVRVRVRFGKGILEHDYAKDVREENAGFIRRECAKARKGRAA